MMLCLVYYCRDILNYTGNYTKLAGEDLRCALKLSRTCRFRLSAGSLNPVQSSSSHLASANWCIEASIRRAGYSIVIIEFDIESQFIRLPDKAPVQRRCKASQSATCFHNIPRPSMKKVGCLRGKELWLFINTRTHISVVAFI